MIAGASAVYPHAMSPSISLIITSYNRDRYLTIMTFHFRLLRRSVYGQFGGLYSTFQWAACAPSS
jgi:hypothetical protein